MKEVKIIKDSYSFKNFTDIDSAEIKLVWKWRNDERVRKWMYSSDIIPFENHLNFVNALKERTDKLYFLVIRENQPIGVFSLIDIKNSTGEWGYYIAPEYHDHSLGVEFYYYVLQFIFDSLNIEKLIGYAIVSNNSANSLNSLFGFTKKLVEKTEKGKTVEYYYRELYSSVWDGQIRNEKKVVRLLQLTVNKQI